MTGAGNSVQVVWTQRHYRGAPGERSQLLHSDCARALSCKPSLIYSTSESVYNLVKHHG